ncbi:MAG: stage II sporulation protein E, partial [Oscillochloris sp.]|nr:stage II sporulation protein E [Oscillochloris sp.]
MSLSTKLSITYALILVAVGSVLTFTLYLELRQAQRAVIREHLQDIVSFTIKQIDADFHALIVSKDDEQSAYYRIIKEKLQEIQQTSGAIKHIYTIRRQQDGQVVVVVDNSEHGGAINHVGTVISDGSPLLSSSLSTPDQALVEQDLVTDALGHVVFYGYGPIVDQFGRQDGAVVIELDASMVIASEAHARNTALIVFFVALPLVLIIGIWRVRRLIAPIGTLVKGAEQISR